MAHYDRRMSCNLWDELGRIVPTLGTKEFDTAFQTGCRKAFGNDYCVVYAFPRDCTQAPAYRMFAANDPAMQSSVHSSTDDYMSSGFSADPTLKWYIKGAFDTSRHHVRRITRESIPDENYRGFYFERIGVMQKLSLFSMQNDVCIYMNLYRLENSPAFDSHETNLLNEVGGAFAGILAKQIHVAAKQSQPKFLSPRELSSDYYRQLREKVRTMLLSRGYGLTNREADVCAALAIGMSGEAVSLTLGISQNTVATHRKRCYAKLGISSQAEIFALHHDSVARELHGMC